MLNNGNYLNKHILYLHNSQVNVNFAKNCRAKNQKLFISLYLHLLIRTFTDLTFDIV